MPTKKSSSSSSSPKAKTKTSSTPGKTPKRAVKKSAAKKSASKKSSPKTGAVKRSEASAAAPAASKKSSAKTEVSKKDAATKADSGSKTAAPKKKSVAPSAAVSAARLSKAQELLGYTFSNDELLAQALCHASTRNEGFKDNERLEFLGDAVLGMIVAWFLYEGLKDANQGELSTRKGAMTSAETLTTIAKRLKLGQLLRTGKGQDIEPTPKMEADLVEACIGAIFLDGGMEAAQGFVVAQVISGYKSDGKVDNDPKSKLQHFTLARRLGLPDYKVLEARGPGHAQEFEVEVIVAGKSYGRGCGTSKKRAEKNAAALALEELKSLEVQSDAPATAENEA